MMLERFSRFSRVLGRWKEIEELVSLKVKSCEIITLVGNDKWFRRMACDLLAEI